MTESIIATRDGKVGTVDATSGNFSQIATSNLDFSDIALSNSGELFGITFGNLYKIDRILGSASLVGNFGLGSSVQLNALEFANNILYASDLSKLYTIDISTGTATLAANLGSEFDSSGDLVFDAANNRFLATSLGTNSDRLFSISLTGQATKIGDIGFTNVFGLSLENGNFIGFTEDRKRITINSTSGTGTLDKNLTSVSGSIGGASSILSRTPPSPNNIQQPTITPSIGSSLKTPFEIGKLSEHQDTFNSVDSSNTSDFFRFSLANRSSFNLLLDPQNSGKPSGDATVILRSNDGRIIESGIQTGKTSVISRELQPDDYLIEVQRKPTASDDKIDYNLRTSAIELTEAENQTVSLKSPSEITGFVTNDVNKDGLIDKSPKQNGNDKDKERLSVSISNRNGLPITSIDPNKETWIVVHGNTDSSKSAKMSALADAVAEYKKQKTNSDEEPQVLVVDWNQPADNNTRAGIRPDLGAEWVNKVAEFAVHSLKDVWGISANKINLVGHSLGTFVSGLIAEKYLKYTGSQINKLILLDSARTLKTDLPSLLRDRDQIGEQIADSLDYDLDGSQPGIQSPPNFSEVATFSRSIWGDVVKGDGLGSPRYNETADESIKVEFKNSKIQDSLTNHGDLVYLFSNILKGEDAINSRLSLDAPLNKEWRNIPGGPEAVLEADKPGDLDENKNDKGAKPATLIAKNPDSSGNKEAFLAINEDEIIYGTNGKDTLDGFDFITQVESQIFYIGGSSLYNGLGNDIFYGEVGDDLIFGGGDDDSIYGNRGNDTINGEQDNDIIFGEDNDDRIWGGKGDDIIVAGGGNDNIQGDNNKDFLTGGVGSDILNGGLDDDVLYGGTDKEQDTLIGGLGDTNFLLGLGNGLPVTQDKRNRDKVDIIEDFRAGILLGFGRGGDPRGISAIGLANGLKPNQIEVEKFGSLLNPKTAIIANGQYLAVINGEWLNKADLRLNEIPDLVS